jgi:hypothetical protein
MIAPSSGSAGASQRSWSILPSHLIDGIVVERGMMLLKLQYEGEANRDFGGSHGQNKQEHHLPIRLPPSRAGRDKRQTAGVEHQLNTHQRENQITPRE